ncbi:hypothetical protein [Variovorax sp. J22R115]|uniref:hypothetical protein n=1 Tax=Variovorax sp. J22R115 TaxID=3053509 RepID=UPI0025754FCF|nr:hypothetical protein [Variovorax sp. J22R115]MDM0047403.1 hypothetical protein [Variovorax sp. J22R115]
MMATDRSSRGPSVARRECSSDCRPSLPPDEWDGFDDFAGIPIRLALGEQRHSSAARLELIAEGHRMSEEEVCALALETRS